jgi:hypothetical protein
MSIAGCANGEVLKYNAGSGSWQCGADSTGSGSESDPIWTSEKNGYYTTGAINTLLAGYYTSAYINANYFASGYIVANYATTGASSISVRRCSKVANRPSINKKRASTAQYYAHQNGGNRIRITKSPVQRTGALSLITLKR